MSNLFKKYIPLSVLSFILFCKYDQVFLLSWLFRTRVEQEKAPYRPVYKRLAHGIYIFITWAKVRVLYYANNWIYTTNHKRIAVNYFWFVILSGIFGMVLATVIRLELAYPGVGIFAGDSLQYLSLATAHGVIMVFFMIIPLISGAFANFLLPTQLGVHDVAFPRLNSAAFWFLPGGLMMLGQLICLDRRYQRMNCFNIREAQALLKKRFFVDLINSNDHHTLLAKTMLGLRFKTQDLSVVYPNGRLASTFGLSHIRSSRSFANAAGHDNVETLSLGAPSFLKAVTLYETSYLLSYFARIFSAVVLFIQNPVLNLRLFKKSCVLAWNTKNLDLLTGFEFFAGFFYTLAQTLSTTWTDFKVYRAASWRSFSRVVTRSRLYKNRPRRADLDRLSLDVFFDPFDYALDEEIYPSRPWEFTFTNPFGFTHKRNENSTAFSIHILLGTFGDRRYLIDQVTGLLSNSIKIIENSTKRLLAFQTKLFCKFYRFTDLTYSLRPALAFNLSSTKDVSADSWTLLTRGFVNYWSGTGSVVVDSFSFAYHALHEVKTAKTLGLAHKNYSDFLSIWYLPVVFNQESLPFIGASDMLRTLRFANETACLKMRILWTDLNQIYIHTLRMLPAFSGAQDFAKDAWAYFLSLVFSSSIESLRIAITSLDICKPLYHGTLQFYALLSQSKLFSLISSTVSTSANTPKIVALTANLDKLTSNEESLNNHRGLRFHHPVFAYDYRAGDYFPKFYQENITYLLPTFARITGGVRAPTWFLSDTVIKTLELNLQGFFDAKGALRLRKKFFVSSRPENRSAPTFFFYNFFSTLKNGKSKTPFYWTPFTALTEKFETLFTSLSMQERMYTNWRQLKFTREAWRCKLLIARHQKSLFRRYVKENGIFWAIERNARDLLPGWAMITPFSSRTRFTAIGKVDIGVSAILLVLVSSVISGANFLVTYRYLSTLNNRKMRDARSFFTEGIMCSSWMMIAANPMLMIGLIMLLSDRHWQTSFFDYSGGGDTILFQHMFWFFGHPEVYIVIIPTFGFVNTLFSYYLRKRISARASLLYSIYTIAFLGFFVWGHHMYMVGLSHTTRMLFSTLTVMISVPAATKLMHWCVTLVNSSFVVELPFLFMLTYVFLFVSGGISGMCVAHTGMDILFHDTFYVIGHFHVMFAGAAMFGSFGAFYFYFSAIFGVKYSRVYAYMHFIYYLIGQLLTVIPMFWLGYAGMPRRVLDYPSAFGGWHSIITAGHMLSVAGLISFFMMIFDSLRQSKAATRTTLGIIRYNTRLNFYFYEASRLSFAQQKGSYQYRYFRPTSFKLNGFHYTNYEYLETTLYSYSLHKRK